jgi:hypothetical protein
VDERPRRADSTRFTFDNWRPRPALWRRAEEWRRTVWRPAVAAAGLAPLRAHDLKHTGVAFIPAAGVDPSQIARRAGHAKVATTYDLYGHLLPEVDVAAGEKLDELWKTVVESPPVARQWHAGPDPVERHLPVPAPTWVDGSHRCSERGWACSTPYAPRCDREAAERQVRAASWLLTEPVAAPERSLRNRRRPSLVDPSEIARWAGHTSV